MLVIACQLSRDVIGYEGYKCDDSHNKMLVTVNNSPVFQDYIYPDYHTQLVELAYQCSPSVATLPKMNAVGTSTKFLCSSNGGSWESPFLDVQPLCTITISYLPNSLLYDQIRMCLMCFGARNNKVSLRFNKN